MTEQQYLEMQEDDGTADLTKEQWYSVLEDEDDY